ncbi:MAG: hypothetical protein U0871_17230 [Gemmataceae bacterium]
MDAPVTGSPPAAAPQAYTVPPLSRAYTVWLSGEKTTAVRVPPRVVSPRGKRPSGQSHTWTTFSLGLSPAAADTRPTAATYLPFGLTATVPARLA